jgi:DNA-3-methyladenine glycosylase II
MTQAIRHLRASDPVLRDIIDRVGAYRIAHRDPDFETLVKSIVYQQLSGRVAAVIFSRLVAAAGNGKLTPAAVLRLRPARMRSVGLSQQKTAYIRDLARQARAGAVDFAQLDALDDAEVIRVLTRVKGIGPWTVHMFLIFALRRQDVLPVGDLGIRAAIRQAYGMPALPAPAEMERLAEPWRPWRTVASWYLWRSQEPDANL